jgi:transcriptional regulator with XRE-family HTH domain
MGRGILPENLRADFTRRLRQVRAVFGASIGQPNLSQADFVKMLDIDVRPSAYRRWDNGKTEPPLLVLAAIRRLTGICLDYLIAGLPAGRSDILTPEHNEITPGMRLRWVRELLEPSIEKIAHVMRVSPDRWQRYEDGVIPIPVRIAIDAAVRFGITLDYLYLGVIGDGLEPKLRQVLLAHHPELAGPEQEKPRDTDGAPGEPASGASIRRQRRVGNRSR